MKIALGGAQFGLKYGILNYSKVKKNEIKKIENNSFFTKIKLIDTSMNYGDSESIIGKSNLKKLKIVTKIKLPNSKNIDLRKWLRNKIFNSLKKLNTKKIYGLLIHDVNDLKKKRGKLFLDILKELKRNKIVEKIGISIYSPYELKIIWKKWKPDIVQAPLNVLDQRIFKTGWINKLKKNKIEIHIRSCFLQGILINDIKNVKRFDKYSKTMNIFAEWCKKKDISRLKACLHFVKKFKKIDYLILGINDANQLMQILKIFEQRLIFVPNIFSTNNLSLIDPRKWN